EEVDQARGLIVADLAIELFGEELPRQEDELLAAFVGELDAYRFRSAALDHFLARPARGRPGRQPSDFIVSWPATALGAPFDPIRPRDARLARVRPRSGRRARGRARLGEVQGRRADQDHHAR